MTEIGTLGIVGGTGKLGAAIARRAAKADCKVVMGSRSAVSGREAAEALGHGIEGMSNVGAAAAADMVVVAAQDATLREIAPHVAGKLVVDTTVPSRRRASCACSFRKRAARRCAHRPSSARTCPSPPRSTTWQRTNWRPMRRSTAMCSSSATTRRRGRG